MFAILAAAATSKSVENEQPWPPNFQKYEEFEAERKNAIKSHPAFGEWLRNQQNPLAAEAEMKRDAYQNLNKGIWGVSLDYLKQQYVQETKDNMVKVHTLRFVQCNDVKYVEGEPELSDAEIRAKWDRIRELRIIAGSTFLSKKSSALTALEEDVRVAQMKRRCALGLQPWEDAVPHFKTKPHERPP